MQLPIQNNSFMLNNTLRNYSSIWYVPVNIAIFWATQFYSQFLVHYVSIHNNDKWKRTHVNRFLPFLLCVNAIFAILFVPFKDNDSIVLNVVFSCGKLVPLHKIITWNYEIANHSLNSHPGLIRKSVREARPSMYMFYWDA